MPITLSPTSTQCTCIIIHGANVVIHSDEMDITFEDLQLLSQSIEESILFEEESSNICVLGLPSKNTLPTAYEEIPLRTYFARNGEEASMPYFRAKALYEWLDRTRFCPRCGTRLTPGTNPQESSLTCPQCHNTIFPRIEPCIIVLVKRGNEILLAQHSQRNTQYFSCLAGFIEAGESAEHAVRREIMEETGISVTNIRYFGSQSWPFPSQLMLGFTAEYESGEIQVQESEIQRALWFNRHNCPATPPEGSLAYQLIHHAL